MRRAVLLASALSCAALSQTGAQSSDLQPAMIAQGADSVASKLHYPEKAKAEKRDGAVQFYCEVGTDGRARHKLVIAENESSPFRQAVKKALEQGRFSAARSGGKAVPVMLGGTVLFVSGRGRPTIVVTLATADKSKAVGGVNYVQPQMLRSFTDLERKMFAWRSLLGGGIQIDVLDNRFAWTKGRAAVAEAMLSVDANGNLSGAKITSESIPGAHLGDILLKACEGAKFIPARANGKPVAGQMNLPINFKTVTDPDKPHGGHLPPPEE